MKATSEHELQKQAVDLLSKGNAKSINQDEPGALLYSPSQSSGQILLLLSGSVRLVDNKKIFNSLTLAKLEAPQIIGVDQLLKTQSTVEIRAITSCRTLALNIENLTGPQIESTQQAILKHLNLSECGVILSALEQVIPAARTKFKSASDIKKACKILMPDELQHGQTILYLDEERDGFNYAQILTHEICAKFFNKETWPRLAAVELAEEHTKNTQNQTINPIPSVATPNTSELESLPITSELQDEQSNSPNDASALLRGTIARKSSSCINVGAILSTTNLQRHHFQSIRCLELCVSKGISEQSRKKASLCHGLTGCCQFWTSWA